MGAVANERTTKGVIVVVLRTEEVVDLEQRRSIEIMVGVGMGVLKRQKITGQVDLSFSRNQRIWRFTARTKGNFCWCEILVSTHPPPPSARTVERRLLTSTSDASSVIIWWRQNNGLDETLTLTWISPNQINERNLNDTQTFSVQAFFLPPGQLGEGNSKFFLFFYLWNTILNFFSLLFVKPNPYVNNHS